MSLLYTCSIAMKAAASVDIYTLSSYMQSASYTGSTGVPSRAVVTASGTVFDRIQYFTLSAAEVNSLRANENIFFIEYLPHLQSVGTDLNTLKYHTASLAHKSVASIVEKQWRLVPSGSTRTMVWRDFYTTHSYLDYTEGDFGHEFEEGPARKYPMWRLKDTGDTSGSVVWGSEDGTSSILQNEIFPSYNLRQDSFQNTHGAVFKELTNYGVGPYWPWMWTGYTTDIGVHEQLWTDQEQQKWFASSASGYHLWLHTIPPGLMKQWYSGSSAIGSAAGDPLCYGGNFVLKYFGRWNAGSDWMYYPISHSITATTCSLITRDPTGSYNTELYNSSSHWDKSGRITPNGYPSFNNKSFLTKGINNLDTPKPFDWSISPGTNYSYHLTGKGVDLINMEPCDFKHAEYFDQDGNHRFRLIDWAEHLSLDSTYQPLPNNPDDPWGNGYDGQPWSVVPQGDGYYGHSAPNLYRKISNQMMSHGQLGWSMAGGLVNGFGKDLDLYAMPAFGIRSTPGIGFNGLQNVEKVARFHSSKSIDPGTGFRRPTIVNTSLGWDAIGPLNYFQTGSIATGSMDMSHANSWGHLKGIRISYMNKDFCFMSSSAFNNDGIRQITCSIHQVSSSNEDCIGTMLGSILTPEDPNMNGASITPDKVNTSSFTEGIINQSLTEENFTKVVNGISCSLDVSVNGRQATSNFYYFDGGMPALVDAINKISHATVAEATNYGHGVMTPIDAHRAMYGGLHKQIGISGSLCQEFWGLDGMFHVTASYSGLNLILSSSQHVMGEIKVFTGSMEQMLGLSAKPKIQFKAPYAAAAYLINTQIRQHFPPNIKIDFTPQTPYGGAHQLTLDSDVTASSGIQDIIYRGQSQRALLSSQLHSSCKHKEVYPQARNAFVKYHDHDHFGINNGWNSLGWPTLLLNHAKDFGRMVNLGNNGGIVEGTIYSWSVRSITSNGGYWKWTKGSHPQNYKSSDLAFSIAAQRGVIWCKSAGNDTWPIASSGSATEEPYSPHGDDYNNLADSYYSHKPNPSGKFKRVMGHGYFQQYNFPNNNTMTNGGLDDTVPHDNPDNKFNYTRTQGSNGSVITISGISTKNSFDGSYTRGSHIDGLRNPVYWDDHNPMGVNRTFPSLQINLGHNYGPGVDIYMASDDLRQPSAQRDPDDTSLPLMELPIDHETHKYAATHSIYADIMKKRGGFKMTTAMQSGVLGSNADTYISYTAPKDIYYGVGCLAGAGGTSTASPVGAGMISCYLQANPGAKVMDVRKWLKYYGVPVFRNDKYDKNADPIYYGRYSSSVATGDPQYKDPRMVNLLDGYHGGQMRHLIDGNAKMGHLPYGISGYKTKQG
jgi:hypothetical protein